MPLAVPGQPPAFTFDEDPDRIPHDVLAAWEEVQVRLGNWYVSSNVLIIIHLACHPTRDIDLILSPSAVSIRKCSIPTAR